MRYCVLIDQRINRLVANEYSEHDTRAEALNVAQSLRETLDAGDTRRVHVKRKRRNGQHTNVAGFPRDEAVGWVVVLAVCLVTFVKAWLS